MKSSRDRASENYWTHGRQGAAILRKLDILKRYRLDPQVEDTTIFLVHYHGLLGHVIRGEEPITALEWITAQKDTRLLDAFLIQSVLAAAAVKEGIMISDFLDGFIHYRGVSLEVMKSGTSWGNHLKEVLEEKGRAALNEFQFKVYDEKFFSNGHVNYCGIREDDIENESLWQGRQSAALDRLLKLVGSLWVDYEDLQMHLLEIPINFIYHKKKLKSVGPATFEKQLMRGMELLRLVSSLKPEVRYYLFYCLDHVGGAMRVYDFQNLPDYLGLSESLKLLILSFQALHHYFGITRRGGLISFANLSRQIEKRWEIVKNALVQAPFPERCFDGERAIFTPEQYGELRFQASTQERAIDVSYRDTVQFDSMLQTLFATWDIDELQSVRERCVAEIKQKMPGGAGDFEDELQKAFRQQQNKINERVLKEFQEKLARVGTISEFQKVRQEMGATGAKFAFTEEQKYLLEEISEFNRFRLRDNFLDTIYHQINTLNTKESLLKFWNEIRYELFMYRSFIGKEYETLIAKFIDEKLDSQ